MRAIIPLAVVATISLAAPTLVAADGAARSDAPSNALVHDHVPTALQKLHGTVAAIDERNGKVTLRLPSDETAELKVADGLLFNALRYGDVVNVTIKTVGGAKTIVALDKK